MKFYFYLYALFLTPINLFPQIVELYPMESNMTNDVNLVKDILYTQYNFVIKLKSFQFHLPQNTSVDCDDINLRINGTRDFKFDKTKPIKIYLTTLKLITRNSKVHGVTFGNEIYVKTLRKEKISVILVHELSHTFGLFHCKNICIMNPEYNPKKRNEIWNYHTDKPIYCTECRNKLKHKDI